MQFNLLALNDAAATLHSRIEYPRRHLMVETDIGRAGRAASNGHLIFYRFMQCQMGMDERN